MKTKTLQNLQLLQMEINTMKEKVENGIKTFDSHDHYVIKMGLDSVVASLSHMGNCISDMVNDEMHERGVKPRIYNAEQALLRIMKRIRNPTAIIEITKIFVDEVENHYNSLRTAQNSVSNLLKRMEKKGLVKFVHSGKFKLYSVN